MSDDEFAPEDAFALFGHDLRVSILLELADAEGRALPFSELRERVGERDSGKFNYHLSKLEGRFVGREGDEYRLRFPGHWVIDAIQTGVVHEDESVRDLDVPGTCPHCGGGLRFDYDATTSGRVQCRECEHILIGFPFDPGGVAVREGEALLDAYDRRTRTAWLCARQGVCPVCSGHVERAMDAEVPPKQAATQGHPVLLALTCGQCSFFVNVPVGTALVDHPRVAGFLAERGVDVRERRLWDLSFVVNPGAVAVEGRDPWRVAVRIEADGDSLTATVDGEGTVTNIE